MDKNVYENRLIQIRLTSRSSVVKYNDRGTDGPTSTRSCNKEHRKINFQAFEIY